MTTTLEAKKSVSVRARCKSHGMVCVMDSRPPCVCSQTSWKLRVVSLWKEKPGLGTARELPLLLHGGCYLSHL
jgi:hypothetical protein